MCVVNNMINITKSIFILYKQLCICKQPKMAESSIGNDRHKQHMRTQNLNNLKKLNQ